MSSNNNFNLHTGNSSHVLPLFNFYSTTAIIITETSHIPIPDDNHPFALLWCGW
jgi:hypothetical protein